MSSQLQIYAFCESFNQIEIANHLALEWRDWANVSAVSFGRTFKFAPKAVIQANHLSDFIHLDRTQNESFTEANAISAMQDWMQAISVYDPVTLSFNDGTRIGREFIAAATDNNVRSFILQDGVLGHETNIFAADSHAAFREAHHSIMVGDLSLGEAMRDDALRALYRRHSRTTKIGASRNGIYFVRGDDVKVKMCMLHGVRPDQVHVTGSVHGAMPAGGTVKIASQGKKSLLYIGQCHTRFGLISKSRWIDISRVIFKQLSKLDESAQVFYKFHPSELDEMRAALARLLPGNVGIMPDTVLKGPDYSAFDFVLSESSTSILDALHAGTGVIIQQVDALSERLPPIDHENLHYTPPERLAQTFTSILSGRQKTKGTGYPFEQIECKPRKDFFDFIGREIRKGHVKHRAWPFVVPAPDLRNAATVKVLGSPLSEILADADDRMRAALTSHQVVASSIEMTGMGAYVPFLYALWGPEWFRNWVQKITAPDPHIENPEYVVMANTLATLEPADYRRVSRQIVFKSKIARYIKVARAAHAPELTFQERCDEFTAATLRKVPDAAHYLVSMLVNHVDASERATTLQALLAEAGPLPVNILHRITMEADLRDIIPAEFFLPVVLGRDYNITIEKTASLLGSLITDMPRPLRPGVFAARVRKAAKDPALSNIAMSDTIGFLSGLGEFLVANDKNSITHETFGTALIANVLKNTPKSRRGLRAWKFVQNILQNTSMPGEGLV